MVQPFDEQLVWDARLFVYHTLTHSERPPTVTETAAHFGLSADDAQRLYHELHDRHTLFLDILTGAVRMANPYSAVPTRYRVVANGHTYWANCAWDAFGIPAMLHTDAEIHTRYVDDDQPVVITLHADQFEPKEGVIHFPLPFVRWYDDLAFT